MKKGLVFAGVGVELVCLIIIALFSGSYFDKKFNSEGIFVVIASFIALLIWASHIVFLVKQMDKNEKQ